MKIIQLKKPFYHTIIHDYYTDEEVDSIWEEIHSLRDILDQNEKTAHGGRLSLYLDYTYVERRRESNILVANRKIFKMYEELSENPFASYLPNFNLDHTILNYYPDESFFTAHTDYYVLSISTTLWKTPKAFEGGSLHFPKYDYTPNMNNNTTILFPSFEQHGVTEIKMTEKGYDTGRYTINQFMSITPGVTNE